jgi:hypothetical protein
MKCEIIEDYPDYVIFTNGIIHRYRDFYQMSHTLHNAYYHVSLSNNGKSDVVTVHRLVAKAFIPNPDNLPCVDHIDGNKLNNDVSNLRWVSHAGNAQNYHNNTKEKRAILQYDREGNFIKKWSCVKEILRENPEYTRARIGNSLTGQTEHAYGSVWKYEIPLIKRTSKKPSKGEKFKQIPEFGDHYLEGYSVSKKGNIMNKKEYIISPFTNNGGYKVAGLFNTKSNKRQTYLVHRLVAITYIENDDPENKTFINHIDKDRTNNNADNLEWVTAAENNTHGHGTKIKMINPTTGRTVKRFDSLNEAKIFLGLKKSGHNMISEICKGARDPNEIYHGHKWAFDE